MNFCIHVCMCTTWVFDVSRGQKKEIDALKLELSMVISHHVGAGIQIQFLCKNNEYS